MKLDKHAKLKAKIKQIQTEAKWCSFRFLLTLKKLLFKDKLFSLLVLAPVIICLLYSTLFQSSRYESTAVISIQRNQQGLSAGGIGSLLGVGDNTINIASYVVEDYINSLAIYTELNKQMGLTKLFQSSQIDFFSRLARHPNQKKLLRYYKSMITVYYNSTSQTIEISAQGFSAQQAQQILEHIMFATQNFVNDLDQQLTQQRISFSKKQIEMALHKLFETEHDIVNFQNNRGMIDPKTEIGVVAGIMANLQSQLVLAQTSLADKQAYFQPDSDEIQQTQQKIDALKSQIEVQKQRLLGLGGSGVNEKLNGIVAEFEKLSMQGKIAIAEYAASIQSLELAKSDAIQQKQQVVIVQPPILPDYNKYPRILYNTLIVLAVLSMLFGIIKIITRIIEEHKY